MLLIMRLLLMLLIMRLLLMLLMLMLLLRMRRRRLLPHKVIRLFFGRLVARVDRSAASPLLLLLLLFSSDVLEGGPVPAECEVVLEEIGGA